MRLPSLLALSFLLAACGPSDRPEMVYDSSSAASSLPPALIEIAAPLPGATVKSPLTVTGKARGTWFFEASFPMKLLDSNGNVLAQGPAQAQAEWMTEDFVPFSATLNFTATTATGSLILEKDNPSGMPEHDQSVTIPVSF
jgi:hypothetical protein